MTRFKEHQNTVKNLTSVISTPELVQLSTASKLLRIKQVLNLYPVGRSTLYKMIAENRFPKQVNLSVKSVAWRASEVYAFINSLQGGK